MQLQYTRMDTRRWQRSRSQVRQRRQCLWAAPTRHAAAPDAQPCAAGDPRARAALWARRQAVRGARSCAALLIVSEASLQPPHPARWEAHLDGASSKQGTADDAIHRDPIKCYVAQLQESLQLILRREMYISSAPNQLGWRSSLQHPRTPYDLVILKIRHLCVFRGFEADDDALLPC